jgi:nucleolar protein 16
VSRKASAARVKKRTMAYDPTVSQYWDPSKTVTQNFERVGLVARVNSDLAGKGVEKRIEAWQGKRMKTVMAKVENGVDNPMEIMEADEMFEQMETLFQDSGDGASHDDNDAVEDEEEEEVGIKRKVVEELERRAKQTSSKSTPKLSEQQQSYMKRLTSKHGNDYKKMAMDIKLNPMQYTPRQLEKMASQMH